MAGVSHRDGDNAKKRAREDAPEPSSERKARQLDEDMRMTKNEAGIVGPPNALELPRFAGFATYCRLPRIDQVDKWDVAVIGVPFDTGCSYRNGARFGPAAIRQASRLVRPFNPALACSPFSGQQVVDAGDVGCNPFNIKKAITAIESEADRLLGIGGRLLTFGGDHTIALPLLRAVHRKFGKVALLHFDAHLDTFPPYFGEDVTHGTVFRNASQEGLFDPDSSMHVGIRGPLYSPADLTEDAEMGFRIVHCREMEKLGVDGVISRIQAATGGDKGQDAPPLYISIDVDVLDPAFAPGTGTPEIGGLSSRELQGILRGLAGRRIVGADIVEVAPCYDHAEVTSLAAAGLGYELLSLMSLAS